MKQLLVGLLLAAGASTAAQAQARWGVKAGGGLATVRGTVIGVVTPLPTVHGGGTLNVPLTAGGWLSIQSELLYSQKGNKAGSSAVYRDHYIDLPVLARLSTGRFFLEAGPQAGMLLGSRYRRDGFDENGKARRWKGSSTDGFGNLDVGYAAGMGYQAKSGPVVGLRYNSSLLHTGQFAPYPRNVVAQVYVGYVFGPGN